MFTPRNKRSRTIKGPACSTVGNSDSDYQQSPEPEVAVNEENVSEGPRYNTRAKLDKGKAKAIKSRASSVSGSKDAGGDIEDPFVMMGCKYLSVLLLPN